MFCIQAKLRNIWGTVDVSPHWMFESFGCSPGSKQVAMPSSLCSHRLWTWFLQTHTLLITWNLLFGWLPDPNSIIAGMPRALRSAKPRSLFSASCHTFILSPNIPVQFSPSAHSVMACFVLSGKVNFVKGSFNKRRIAWKGQERASGGEPPSNED